MANSKGIPNAGGYQNGTNHTVMLAITVMVIVVTSFAFIFALVVWGAVDPNILLPAVLPMVAVAVGALFNYFKSQEAAREARAARMENAATNVKVQEVAKAVDGMTSELVAAKTGQATAEATLTEKAAQEARSAEIAQASATKSTTTTTTSTDSSKVAVEPLPATGAPGQEPPKEGG